MFNKFQYVAIIGLVACSGADPVDLMGQAPTGTDSGSSPNQPSSSSDGRVQTGETDNHNPISLNDGGISSNIVIPDTSAPVVVQDASISTTPDTSTPVVVHDASNVVDVDALTPPITQNDASTTLDASVKDAAVCRPTKDCSFYGWKCGQFDDGCGKMLECRVCTGYDTCGGGKIPGSCGCTPKLPTQVCPPDATCGYAPDGCGGFVQCGQPSQCGDVARCDNATMKCKGCYLDPTSKCSNLLLETRVHYKCDRTIYIPDYISTSFQTDSDCISNPAEPGYNCGGYVRGCAVPPK